jgi:hypothetical protein
MYCTCTKSLTFRYSTRQMHINRAVGTVRSRSATKSASRTSASERRGKKGWQRDRERGSSSEINWPSAFSSTNSLQTQRCSRRAAEHVQYRRYSLVQLLDSTATSTVLYCTVRQTSAPASLVWDDFLPRKHVSDGLTRKRWQPQGYSVLLRSSTLFIDLLLFWPPIVCEIAVHTPFEVALSCGPHDTVQYSYSTATVQDCIVLYSTVSLPETGTVRPMQQCYSTDPS